LSFPAFKNGGAIRLVTQLVSVGLGVFVINLLLAFAPASAETAPAAGSQEIRIYVSTQGNDAWSGANPDLSGAAGTGPLATIKQARLKVRDILASKPNMPVTVYVRGGKYYLAETLELDSKDSGTAAAPVTYRSYPGETVVLSGARPISGFTAYKGQILKADVSAQGLKDNYFRDLYFDGSRQILARYPNFDPKNPITGGWAFVAGTQVYKDAAIPGEGAANKTQFIAKANDIHNWAHPEDGEVFIFPRLNYWNNILPITSVDAQSHLISLKSPASYAIRPGDRYYVRNLLEELDAPGEWYLDKATNTLYFWPPAPLASKAVEAPAIQTIFQLDPGVSYVTIRGFTIEMAQKSAIVLNKTLHCLIAGNIIRHVGDYTHNAVVVTGTGNGVAGNDIYDVGDSAIYLGGGDTPSLTPAGNYADNNYIHHTGVYYKQGVGIAIEGVGNRASHNLIHDTPRFAIQFSGNNHVIEYNYLHDTSLETEDTSAIYTGAQDWIGPRGSTVRGNYVYNTYGLHFDNGVPQTPYLSWGIYLDDYSAGVTVDGNIVIGSLTAGLHVNNGSFNNVINNIFADNRGAQASFEGSKTDSKGWLHLLPQMEKNYNLLANAPAWDSLPGARIDPQKAGLADGTLMQGNKFEHNILYNRASPESLLYHFYASNPAYNLFDYNLFYNFNHQITADNSDGDYFDKVRESLSDWQKRTGMDKNSVAADPLFVDPDHGNYDLQAASPALALGIKTTAMKDIGPYQDPLRASWPIVEAPR